MKLSYKILISVLLSSILALPASAFVPTGNWTVIPGPENATLKSITFSANYLWGIDNSYIAMEDIETPNLHYCQRPCSNASSWKSSGGQLDQTIDANETEVWGVNDRYLIYKRPVDASNGWVQITGLNNHLNCGGECFSDVSVSKSGYVWAISRENETYILCRQGGVSRQCGNRDRMLIDNELFLVHIEAGDEEVWAVNATNHIFKRPVNGSGNWSIVPGEMRYISASGNAHIWGIAPNDSLYVCEKPCTGDWQYVGGTFQQIEGGINSVVGVTTNYSILSMSLEGVNNSYVTVIASVVGAIVFIVLLLIVSGIVLIVMKVLKRKRHRKDTLVKYTSSEGGYVETEESSRVDSGFDNQVYSNRSSTDPEYDSIDNASISGDNNVKTNRLGHDSQSAKLQKSGSHDFRNRVDSIPNVYTLHSTNQSTPSTLDKGQSGMLSVTNDATDNYEQDSSLDKNYCKPGETIGDEYDYANEEEFWEPAYQEKELKTQVEKLTGVPVINRDALHTHEELGSGQFGTVYRGVWQQAADSEDTGLGVEVAVKTMEEGASEDERVKFLQEAAIMGQFRNHPNIVRILGIVLDAPYKIVTELMHRGDLHHYLATLRPNTDQPVSNELGPILLSYTRQVALGLMYLSFKKYIHRDIAARNVLVNDEGICKIADFGLSRDLFDEDYYVSHGGKVPIKWTAPEAINYRKYSMASDVWSYGCLLYEIWSLGVKPFHDISNKQAIDKIGSGYRLPPPPGCPKTVYQIMIKCWHPTAASRPTPSGIVTGLSHPDFQILKWSQKDIDATSEQARTPGAPLTEGYALYKGLQQKYMPSANS